MMSPTHVATGVVIAAPFTVLAPELATLVALAAMVGGVFPDLDLFVGVHRKTLHFPVYYWAVVIPTAALAAVVPSAATIAAFFFFLSAAVHSVADWFCGGNELRPWEMTSEHAVFVHPLGRWLPPKRLVRWDGSPEDLLLTVLLSLPGLFLFEGPVRLLTVAVLVVAVVYAAVRKRVPDLAPWLAE
ncbi:metal-dependent hydrolase [Haloprofundus halophilus]|uniref:metal-dependent hydrolase n=1 Tax=Haloprofundus halophilus TaxID=2283527 RepID=UPI000E4489FE|nr:metal-dependent hydrolase [Haloprofundus halophilus]